MPIVIHNTTIGTWTDSPSQSLAKPTRSDGSVAQIGDLLIAVTHLSGTEVAGADGSLSLELDTSNNNNCSLKCYTRFVQSGESASYNFTYGSGARALTSITLIEGARPVSDGGPVGGIVGVTSGISDDNVSAPSINSPIENGTLICAYIHNSGNITSSSTATVPLPLTERYDSNSEGLSAAKRVAQLATQTLLPVGATGARTSTTTETSQERSTLSLLILPAVDYSIITIGPDSILSSTSLTGTVVDIQDDPDSPNTNWLTAT